MKIYEKFPEMLHLSISGPCPEDCINRMNAQGIVFQNYKKQDEFSGDFYIRGVYLSAVQKAAAGTQCEITLLSRRGIKPFLNGLGKRGAFFVFLIALALIAYSLQNRVWFLEVSGNELIHEDEILRLLEDRGVDFGTAFDSVDMELLRNEILGEIPLLDYITMNTAGGFAEVIVRERTQRPLETADIGPKNIVSTGDGVIESVTVTAGTPLVSTGEVVTKGQILISGVTDLERITLVSGAEGEVYARTYSPYNAITEARIAKKEYTGREMRRFSITFGKNTINLFKTSGISYDNYDKMTLRKTLTLPGDYALPLTLTVTTFREYFPEDTELPRQWAEQLLLQSLRREAVGSMTAGEILQENLTFSRKKGFFSLSGILECREEIGCSVEIKE